MAHSPQIALDVRVWVWVWDHHDAVRVLYSKRSCKVQYRIIQCYYLLYSVQEPVKTSGVHQSWAPGGISKLRALWF
jgi:hypothetical protein